MSDPLAHIKAQHARLQGPPRMPQGPSDSTLQWMAADKARQLVNLARRLNVDEKAALKMAHAAVDRAAQDGES
jgi:hypothetical protein